LVKKEQKGMLNKVQAYITFGEIDSETLESLLQKRGRIAGNKKLDQTFLKEKKVKDLKQLANDLIEGKTKLKFLGIKPVFRLRPPKKGYERAGIKKGYSVGGALGYRASDINKLVKRMI
jgi:large subunit ribosomal protein L30